VSRTLVTVGYEGRGIDDFVACLKKYAIDCLLDVREVPLSRKPGFSKTKLARRLNKENILYVHFKELGSPKPLRQKLKENRDYAAFFKKMNEYLADKTKVLQNAYEFIANKTCCLMCFEHRAESCHRKIVAEQLKKLDGNGLKIKNI